MTGEQPGGTGQDGQTGETTVARDSKGELVQSPKASSTSSSVSKTAIDELANRVNGQTISIAMAHLETIYSAPTPLTNDEKFARAKLWLEACKNLPSVAFLAAIGAHIKSSKFFPTPIEIIELAQPKVDMLQHAAEQEVARKAPRGLHPFRLKPPPADFVFNQSKLREAPGWRHFLDSIHPTAEHFYFGNAKCGHSPEIAIGFSKFERDYVVQNYGHLLPKFFMSAVQLLLNETDKKPVVLFEPEVQSEEAKARVSEMMTNFRQRMAAEFKATHAPKGAEPT